MLRKKYDALVSKYKLPNYDDIDREFEVSFISKDLEEINFPLRVVRRKMNDRLAMFANGLQNIISPATTSIISMHESKFFSDDDKECIIDIIKQLMQIERHSLLLDITSSEKDDAEWIVFTYQKWMGLKKHLMKFVEIIRDGWQKEEEQSDQTYFG